MFQYSDIPWNFCYLPLKSNLIDHGAIIDTTIIIEGVGGSEAADFSTTAKRLTLDGTNYLKIPHSTIVESLFTIGTGSAMLFINLKSATPAIEPDTLASIPGGKNALSNGLIINLHTLGNARNIIDADTSYPFATDSTYGLIADGNDHNYCLLISPDKNELNTWIDGHTAPSGRQSLANAQTQYTNIENILTGSATPHVLLGARQPNDASYVNADQFMTGTITEFAWINFGSDVPDAIQLNKMARDYNATGFGGSNFT